MAEQKYTAEVERLWEVAFAVDMCHDEAVFVSEVEAPLRQEVYAAMQGFVDTRLDVNLRFNGGNTSRRRGDPSSGDSGLVL